MAGRCGCGSGSCACQIVGTPSVKVSGTGSSGAPFAIALAQRVFALGWGGAAKDLVFLESHRMPVPACTLTSAQVTVTDPNGGATATQFQFCLDGTPVGTTVTIPAGTASLTVTPGLVFAAGGVVSIRLNGTRGEHINGLVTVTCDLT